MSNDFITTHIKPITKSIIGSYTLMSLATSGSSGDETPIIQDVFSALFQLTRELNDYAITNKTPLDFELHHVFNDEHYKNKHSFSPLLNFGNSPFMFFMENKNSPTMAMFKITNEVTHPCTSTIKEYATELYNKECREYGDAVNPLSEFIKLVKDEIHDNKRRMPLKTISRDHHLIIDFKNGLICTKNAKVDTLLTEMLIRLLIGAAKSIMEESHGLKRKLEPHVQYLEKHMLVIKNYATSMITQGNATSAYSLKELIAYLAEQEQNSAVPCGHLPLWSGRFCAEGSSKDTINVGNLLHLLIKEKSTAIGSFASFTALDNFATNLELSTTAFRFQSDLERGPLLKKLEETIPEASVDYGTHIPVIFETWEKMGNIAFKFISKLEPYQEAAKRLAQEVKLSEHLSLIDLERTILDHAAMMLEPLHQSINIFIQLFLSYQKPIELLEGSEIDTLLQSRNNSLPVSDQDVPPKVNDTPSEPDDEVKKDDPAKTDSTSEVEADAKEDELTT